MNSSRNSFEMVFCSRFIILQSVVTRYLFVQKVVNCCMKKYENFCKALNNLKEIQKEIPPYSTVVQTGMVSLYEICFEQAWKAMKEVLENNGYSQHKIGSPRTIIKMAYQANLIDDEDCWLEALRDRNNVAHSYNEEIANNIIKDSKEKYIAMFEGLQREIEKNWL